MILNQPDFFARSATLNGAITGTDTQITISGLSTRFTDAVAAGTVRYPIGPFRVSDDDGFELIAITGHVSGTTFEVERGIQGTSEEAWADGTAVRAVVTRGQMVSHRNAVYPQIISTGFTEAFIYEDGNIDGKMGPNGELWEVHGAGTATVENNRLVIDASAGETWAVLPVSNIDAMWSLQKYSTSSGQTEGVVHGFVDDDNYEMHGWQGHIGASRIGFIEVVNGVEAEVYIQSLSNSPINRPIRGGTRTLRIENNSRFRFYDDTNTAYYNGGDNDRLVNCIGAYARSSTFSIEYIIVI